MASEDRRNEAELECLYKTKIVQFLGRNTPIILQNENGPCPLLAICNLLLLKNNFNLNVDVSEVSQQKLLSLVAEKLIDSNSNIENKDAGYVENQQQNIADAIDLLPRLATGIDVNIKFRRINDFEFTRECAIFDLLDIPLYHGWIVDPQDSDTANAIGSKSYNTVMGELVALETKNSEHKSNSEEDLIDFVAATAATLGVPSPSLSRGRSFDESHCVVSGCQEGRKGDVEEQTELLRVLKLSEDQVLTSVESPSADKSGGNRSAILEETEHLHSNGSEFPADSLDEQEVPHLLKPSVAEDHAEFCVGNKLVTSSETTLRENDSCSNIEAGLHVDQLKNHGSQEHFISSDLTENSGTDILDHNQSEPLQHLDPDFSSPSKDHVHGSERDPQVQLPCLLDTSISEVHHAPENNLGVCETTISTCTFTSNPESDETSGSSQHIDQPNTVARSLEGSEPLYEGEERMLDSGLTAYENREPMYEGEMALAEQADSGAGHGCGIHPKDEITQQKGELIKNFLRNSASQLTIYGLFSLQEGLKERELCVFFRNNHFSTMFKFNGELYLLATDQGYINQHDLVWEKLNEVNGDTVFMTGNFKEFKVENHVNDQWNEQNAVASAADYIASIDKSVAAGSTLNSDLQLAIALQQQEFDQQPQRQNTQQSSTSSSRLVVGPQVPKSSGSHSSSKQESKAKEKCIVM